MTFDIPTYVGSGQKTQKRKGLSLPFAPSQVQTQ